MWSYLDALASELPGMKIAPMKHLDLHNLLLLTFALLLGSTHALAAESYDNCTGFVTSLPATISTQGTWCLKQNLSTAITSGDAITVNTNNVTIDCNGFKLDGAAGGVGTQAIAIYAKDKFNLTVRHCDLRGFIEGVALLASSSATSGGHTVEDNRFVEDTLAAIEINGDGSVVRRNQIYNIGGSPVFSNAVGIFAVYSVDVLDNLISGITAASGSNGYATGIYTSTNSSGRIIGNGVRGLAKDGTGKNDAIDNVNSTYIAVRDNDLAGDASTGSVGLICENSDGSAADNVINGFATGYQSCTDAGGNDITP